MTTTSGHPCPWTAGDLLALDAIAEARSQHHPAPAGAARLARLCFDHARQHQTPTEGDQQ